MSVRFVFAVSAIVAVGIIAYAEGHLSGWRAGLQRGIEIHREVWGEKVR